MVKIIAMGGREEGEEVQNVQVKLRAEGMLLTAKEIKA